MTHEKVLESLLFLYNLTPDICTKSAWGYNSVAYFVQVGEKKFSLRINDFTQTQLDRTNNDVKFCLILKDDFIVSYYIPNVQGKLVSVYENKIFRLAKYILGVCPFDMNWEILENAVCVLGKLHKFPVIHGDFTPSNILVCNQKICGILDFEYAKKKGFIEWDLASAIVFFWYRFGSDTKFEDVYNFVLAKYSDPFDIVKIKGFILSQASDFLDTIIKYKSDYQDQNYWLDRFTFVDKRLKEIKQFMI